LTSFAFDSTYCADSSKRDTLAIIGNGVITTEQFVASYKEKLTKIGLTDNGDTRLNYLMNLVIDELLIAEAKNRGFDKTSAAKKEYRRIRLQELLNAYTEKYISPNVKATEDDLIKLFSQFNTKVKVSHLYAPTKEEADTLCSKLVRGEEFEDLAKQIFDDPNLRDNGGSLGYISMDEMDIDFEKAAFSMKVGEISPPIKTVQGYSIIRVDDIKTNPLLTENEFLKSQGKLKALARKRKFEEASKLYAQTLREKLHVKFNDALITKIFEAIKGKSLLDFSETHLEMLHNDLNKTVVYTEMGNWSLQTLFNEMSLISDKQKKFIRTKENLDDLIAGLVNRKYITQKAAEESLDKTTSFYKNVEFNFNTYLLTTIEGDLKKQISISPDSVKAYFSKNIRLFKTEPSVRLSSILVDNSQIADSIQTLLKEGISFEALAKRYSIQTFTAEDNGDMGYFKRNELDDLADDIFTLRVGQWAGPFANSGKIVFIKCTDIIESVVKSFEQSKDEIEKTLISFEWYKVKDKYIQSLKNNIGIKLFPQKLFGIKF
jgi:parvulin-like peptidyl-prolyl isomerase